MTEDAAANGEARRQQGYYAECVVQAIAASARLYVTKEDLEPEDVDLQVRMKRRVGLPRVKRVELQVKSTSQEQPAGDVVRVRMSAAKYHALNGEVGVDFDLRRYLVVVTLPNHFSEYCRFADNSLEFRGVAYWLDLMDQPDLPDGQASTTVSVPRANLLTPGQIVALTCGDGEEAAAWMRG